MRIMNHQGPAFHEPTFKSPTLAVEGSFRAKMQQQHSSDNAWCEKECAILKLRPHWNDVPGKLDGDSFKLLATKFHFS